MVPRNFRAEASTLELKCEKIKMNDKIKNKLTLLNVHFTNIAVKQFVAEL